jgi:hypothetical protein
MAFFWARYAVRRTSRCDTDMALISSHSLAARSISPPPPRTVSRRAVVVASGRGRCSSTRALRLLRAERLMAWVGCRRREDWTRDAVGLRLRWW